MGEGAAWSAIACAAEDGPFMEEGACLDAARRCFSHAPRLDFALTPFRSSSRADRALPLTRTGAAETLQHRQQTERRSSGGSSARGRRRSLSQRGWGLNGRRRWRRGARCHIPLRVPRCAELTDRDCRERAARCLGDRRPGRNQRPFRACECPAAGPCARKSKSRECRDAQSESSSWTAHRRVGREGRGVGDGGDIALDSHGAPQNPVTWELCEDEVSGQWGGSRQQRTLWPSKQMRAVSRGAPLLIPHERALPRAASTDKTQSAGGTELRARSRWRCAAECSADGWGLDGSVDRYTPKLCGGLFRRWVSIYVLIGQVLCRGRGGRVTEGEGTDMVQREAAGGSVRGECSCGGGVLRGRRGAARVGAECGGLANAGRADMCRHGREDTNEARAASRREGAAVFSRLSAEAKEESLRKYKSVLGRVGPTSDPHVTEHRHTHVR
ncbi:hypothetical protein C8R43DRAFT_1010062 [Mycena crocata]|nr:hypothetical protein C8R43DRAFT_1010033 [Mycena crocata]KAJ7147608.1 hypothetical protein C8R43DRAFT_1010062 [Mycena crocata]